jgi:hypothetical protein
VTVKLGVWILNTKSRMDQLDADQLAALAEPGMDWAKAGDGPAGRPGQSLTRFAGAWGCRLRRSPTQSQVLAMSGSRSDASEEEAARGVRVDGDATTTPCRLRTAAAGRCQVRMSLRASDRVMRAVMRLPTGSCSMNSFSVTAWTITLLRAQHEGLVRALR